MIIIAIETSCDETSCAIVKDGKEVLSVVTSSQNDFHTKFGGIVPEIASRKHIENITIVIQEAIDKAKINLEDIEAVAVTFGPGLPGSLIVGLSAAKAISLAIKKPIIAVNHIEGHIYANFLMEEFENLKEKVFPFLSLIVSGGHTQLVKVTEHLKYETIGRTRDDAAGEAFDKVARFLGLGYPGGPIIDKVAKDGNENAIDFKRPMIEEQYRYDFSFSGIKTAVVYYYKKMLAGKEKEISKIDIAASFQKAVIDTLVEKTIRAAKELKIKTVTIGGGVAANSKLRSMMLEQCKENDITCFIPPLWLCTDNAAMIGCNAFYKFQRKIFSDYTLSINSTARV